MTFVLAHRHLHPGPRRARTRPARHTVPVAAVAAAAWAVALATADSARAATSSWDGGGPVGSLGPTSRLWIDLENWSPDGVPSSTSDVVLGAGIAPNTIIETYVGMPPFGGPVPYHQYAKSLTIDTANAFSMYGSRNGVTLTLTTGDLTRNVVNNAEGDHSIAPLVYLGDHGVWTVNDAGKLRASIDELGGPRNFTKTGLGLLEADLWITGAVTVNAGTLKTSWIYGASSVTVESNGVLDWAGTLPCPVTLFGKPGGFFSSALSVPHSSTISGHVTLTDNPGLSISQGATLTLSGGMTNTGTGIGFTHYGPGSLLLTAPATGNFSPSVLGGQLTIAHNTALGASGTVNLLDISGGASTPAIAFADGVTAFPHAINLRRATVRGLGNATANGNLTLDAFIGSDNVLDVPGAAHTLTLNGAISGPAGNTYSFTKTGSGTLVLGGARNYTGPLVVAQGTLAVTTDAALSPTVATPIQAGARFELRNGQTLNRPLRVTGAGPGNLGVVRSAGGNNTFAGAIELQSSVTLGAAAGSSLTITGPLAGAFALIKADGGTLRLTNAANNFTSLTVAAGTLSLSSHTGIPASLPINVSSGAGVSLFANAAVNRPLNVSGTGPSAAVGAIDSESGSNTWLGTVNLQGATTVSVRSGSLTLPGNLAAAFALTKTGTGNLILSGSNAHADTTVEHGLLSAQSSAALPANRTVTVADGATLAIAGGIVTSPAAPARLSGPGLANQGALAAPQGSATFAGPVKLLAPGTTVGAAASSTLTLSGVISDDATPLPLVKVGNGTLVLTAANTYRGGTVVNAGTLAVTNDNQLGAAGAPVSVNNGSRLRVTQNMSTPRTVSLNTGSLQVDDGVQLTYQGATVSGGFLRGPGTHAITGAASTLGGVTALPGSRIVQSGPALFGNFSNAGSFTNAAPLTWDGGFNLGGGALTVSSALSTEAFQNDGQITISAGGTLSNSASNLASTGGSRILVNPGGSLHLNSTSLQLNGALLTNNGVVDGPVFVNYGSTARGAGTFNGAVTVSDGGVFEAANPAAAPASLVVGSLSLAAPTAAADIASSLVIDYAGPSPLPAILASIRAAYHGGLWDRPGIGSSLAADPANDFLTAVAYADNASLGLTTFAGRPTDPTTILLLHTYYGDANLNGAIDPDDYALLDRSFARQPAAATWTHGDFNYDGQVTTADYLLIDRTHFMTGSPAPSFLAGRESQFGADYVAELLASVPEPGSVGLLVPLLTLLSRRRRE